MVQHVLVQLSCNTSVLGRTTFRLIASACAETTAVPARSDHAQQWGQDGDAPPAKLGGALAPKGLPPAMIS
jgi:hypothetical protein